MPSLKESFLAFLAVNNQKEIPKKRTVEEIFNLPFQEEE